MNQPLPRIVFVLGKGGVGRSTVATSFATALARRNERALVFEWAIAEGIAPWYGLAPAGIDPVEVEPRTFVANFSLDDSLRAYFVNHLGLGGFYNHVINGRAVKRLVEAAPGIAEMMFLGHLWWLTTLAEKEVGLHVDRVVVDCPATGHGESLLDLPATLASLHASGLLGTEVARVVDMMGDCSRTGAIVVTTPEELAVEETLELLPRAAKSLGRSVLATIVNRSAQRLVSADLPEKWLDSLALNLAPQTRAGLEMVTAELRDRVRIEADLRVALAAVDHGVLLSLDEQLGVASQLSPRTTVAALADQLAAFCAEHS